MSQDPGPVSSPSTQVPQHPDGKTGEALAAPRKRRRWLRRLVILAVLLVVFVFLVPYLASTGAGTRLIVGFANGSIPGKLSIEDLSVRWFGACTLKGASLRDLQDKEVIRVDGVVYGNGLWGAITSALNFGELKIDAPKVWLYFDGNGHVSLVDALVRPQTTKPPSNAPLPKMSGRIVLQNGSVKIVQADGHALDDLHINASCSLNEQDTLDVTQLAVDSHLLALKLGGKVTELSGAQRLALTGEYKGAWDSITALIHEFAPATVETVKVTGSTSGRFEVSGAAYRPNVHPVFEDAATQIGINWDSAFVYGLRLGKGEINPGLKQGQLTIPLATIPATDGGQVHLGGLVDFHPQDPTLFIRERTALLESIPVTPELGKELLSRVNPIFGSMSRAEGTASLYVQSVELPLGEALKQHGTGQGRLDLRGLKIAPGGLMAEAMALGSLGNQNLYTVKVEGLDFSLKDGRLHYENFALIFAEDFDLRFRGSVGFDDTLDLVMSVPVKAPLLERCGVRGVAAEYTRLLSDMRVDIPIVGTRLQPKLDFAKVDTKAILERTARGAVTGKAGDLLKNLGAGGNPIQPQPAKPQSGAAPKQKSDSGAKSALDLLNRGIQDATSKPSGSGKGK